MTCGCDARGVPLEDVFHRVALPMSLLLDFTYLKADSLSL